MDAFKPKWQWTNSHVRWIGSVNRMVFFLFSFDRFTNIWNALISLNLVDYGLMFYWSNLFNFRCSHAINGKEWASMKQKGNRPKTCALRQKILPVFFFVWREKEKVALILEAVYLTLHWSVSPSGTGRAIKCCFPHIIFHFLFDAIGARIYGCEFEVQRYLQPISTWVIRTDYISVSQSLS